MDNLRITFPTSGDHVSDHLALHTRYNAAALCVKDYGAVGDGVKDDSAAIQAAIDAGESAGVHVFLSPGTFYLGTTSLTVSASYIPLFGSGAGISVLDYRGSDYAIRINCGTSVLTGIRMYDFGITCQYTGANKGIYVYGAGGGGLTDSIFERLAIKDCGNAGIYSDSTSIFKRNTFRDCRITHCGDFGIAGWDQEDCTFDNNYLEDFASVLYPAHAIYLKKNAYRNKVINNTIVACLGAGSSGIIAYGETGTALDNLIEGNVIRNGLRGVHIIGANRTKVTGNAILSDDGSGETGVLVSADTGPVTISQNIITGMSSKGIQGAGTSGHVISELIVEDNILYDNAGGDFCDYVTRLRYANNYNDPVGTAVDGAYSLRLDHGSNASISGNHIVCGLRGIVAANMTSVIITDNIFSDNSLTDADICIYVSSTTRALITGNDVTGIGTSYGIINGAVEAITENNPGVFTSLTAAPTTGSAKIGNVVWSTTPSSGATPGWICTHSGTFSAATDNTGDADGSTAVITGMTDTSDFFVGQYVDVSAGFATTGPYRILELTATTMTLDTASNAVAANITVSTSDPTWTAMANLA